MLHLHFNSEPSVVTATPLPHAQLPLLKLQVAVPGSGEMGLIFDVDVSVAVGYEHGGNAATTIICAELDTWPTIRPLLLVTKTYLSSLGLNTTWTGGLCSHALFLLVRAYIVSLSSTAGDRPSSNNLGAALIGLLEWYGSFDFSRVQARSPVAPRSPGVRLRLPVGLLDP